ncbi:MAG: cbb3-type cytochrome c oxidase subunit I [Verrucomicrobiales bacterium]
MSATTHEPPAAARPGSLYAQPGAAEIDASCRKPVLFLFLCGMAWLVLGSFIAVFASIKLHGPGLLAEIPAFTYGRLSAASTAIFLYGFASQVAMAVGLWLIARLARTFLVMPNGVVVAGIIWNLTLLLGVVAILAGGLTGHPGLQLPGWALVGLFVSFAIAGMSALITLRFRTECEMYPSLWFLIAGFVWFPWILSSAGLLLHYFPTRAVLHPVIATWFANNFATLWLGSIALAVIFYFVARLGHQPLFSGSVAAFGFWLYVIFSTAGGFQSLGGIPNWMPGLSSAAAVMLLIPAFAFGYNWLNTGKIRSNEKTGDRTGAYIKFSMIAFFAFVALNALASLRPVDKVLGLTIFHPGLEFLHLYGFVAMALLGAVNFIAPRMVDLDWPKANNTHYLLSAVGIGLAVAALCFGGWIHGSLMNNPQEPFITSVRRTVPFIGIATLGYILFFVAQLMLFANLLRLVCASCCNLRWNATEGSKR